jgi:probable selenium-dependent hydroxylase accessory protein YqeC
MDSAAQMTFAHALSFGPQGVLALVGAGGKTTALRLVGAELAAAGARVVATTTTAMRVEELADVGPLFLQAEDDGWAGGLTTALAPGRPAAVARARGKAGKVLGLTPISVDGLWASRVADCLVVEADGSRGLPFKAFGPHEPQVPSTATTIVAVAGLDALGAPLTAELVHRADVLAQALGVPLGAEVTAAMMADGLRAQVVRLRDSNPDCRVVVLLNKADTPGARSAGLEIARELLGGGSDRAVTPAGEGRPDAVVVGSLRERRFDVKERG